MRLTRHIFRTRNRLKALESHLGVYFNYDWEEYSETKHNPMDSLGKRVAYIEKIKLSKKEREDSPNRLY